MKKKFNEVLPLNLQFFAEKDIDDNNASGAENQGDDGGDGGDDNTDDKPASKTFTQDEVNAMMTREKKEGRKSMLKQLGFKSESEAKQAIALYTALVDSQKSEEQKKDEANKGLENAKTEAEKRAEAAEDKLACVIAGVSKDSIDDVLAIAKLKVTEEKNLDKVLAEMKNESRYQTFFGNDGNDDDTGSEPGNSKRSGGKKKGSYGSELAKKSQYDTGKKKTYFN